MSEISPSSRFQVVPVPILAPGICFLCRSGNVETSAPFVDTGMSHTWWNEAPDSSRDGAVYICKNCVTEMAHNLNLIDADVARQVQNARVEGYMAAVQEGKRLVDGFASHFTDSVLGLSFGLSVDVAVPDDDSEEDEPGQQRTAKKSSKTNRQAGIDGSVGRPDDVPGDSTPGDLLGANPFE